MESSSQESSNLSTSLLSWLLGLLGVTALIKLLPRAVKYLVRRWIIGIMIEIVAVILVALLSDKLVDRLAGPPPHADASSAD